MYCGINFSEDNSRETQIAFLSDDIKVFSVKENQALVKLVEEYKPSYIAVNTGLEERKRLSEDEEELKEEGHVFTPSMHDTKKVRRFEAFKAALQQSLAGSEIPEFIRFNPMITGKELAIDSDAALESYGLDTSDIESAEEFDAVLGATTARFYEQGQAKEMGVVVPQPMNSDPDEEE